MNPIPEYLRGLFFLAGPTAVGKTAAALELAAAWDAEIVGADAFQVYAGLGTLTASPSREELARARHHLVGEVPLAEPWDVARYLARARAAIAGIRARGKVAIVAGGTGLYFRALTHGLADLPASAELRAELSAQPLEALVERLRGLDPALAIDFKNPRRVVRALEVCLLTGRPFSALRREWERPVAFRGALLERPREELCERIERRTRVMFDAGVVEEVRAVLEAEATKAETKNPMDTSFHQPSGGSLATASQVIGWREITAHLRGELSREEAMSAIALATRQYAKRQMTWFRREPMLAPTPAGPDAAARLASDFSATLRRDCRRAVAAASGPAAP